MKELSIEEKARSYDKAIEKGKQILNTPYTAHWDIMKEVVEHILPELAESEDEKIRKTIIQHFKTTTDAVIGHSICNIPIEKVLAWLEKQGEQKPNFCHHEVDLSECSEEYRKAYYDGWNNCNMQHSQCKSELDDVVKCLINGMKFYYENNEEATWGTDKWSMPVKHIIEVLEKQGEQILANSAKTCKDEQNPADKIEPKFKIGDVIRRGKSTLEVGGINLERQFYELRTREHVVVNCVSFSEQELWELVITPSKVFTGDEENERVRNFLIEYFEKLVDEDSEYGLSNETRNIVLNWLKNQGEQKPAIEMKTPEESLGIDSDTYNKIVDECIYGEQKSSWSEEDEKQLQHTIAAIQWYAGGIDIIDWLKSLKDRVLQHPQKEWSDEDKRILESVINDIKSLKQRVYCKSACDEEINWLQSLRPQSHWKPSDEQMEVLQWCMPLWAEPKSKAILESLINDLKKLREE